jgi:secreted trypsin-like serine protease
MHHSRGPKSLLAMLAAVTMLLMVMIAPVSAVTKGGTVDSANQYPYVGLMVAYVYDEATKTYVPSWRCTGTLVSPQLFVTAGHCTDGADWVEIWFDWDVTDAANEGYPFYGEGDAGGTPHTHPDYDPNAFYLHDLGVVTLSRKEAYRTPNNTYATLPGLDDVGMLDNLAVGTVFTTVGYGLHTAYPDGTPADEKEDASRLRMIARPRLLQYVSDPSAGNFALHFGSNSKTGGTCFGDSGGPTFYNGVLVGVTSFAYTETCAGRDGIYRLDQADDLNWLYTNFGHLM